jgi:hypothetical protein
LRELLLGHGVQTWEALEASLGRLIWSSAACARGAKALWALLDMDEVGDEAL